MLCSHDGESFLPSRPCCLVHRCPGGSIPRHEEAQFHRAPVQNGKHFETCYKPLAAANGSQPSRASETVTDGDVTTLNGFGWCNSVEDRVAVKNKRTGTTWLHCHGADTDIRNAKPNFAGAYIPG
jgi:hypothetical protein